MKITKEMIRRAAVALDREALMHMGWSTDEIVAAQRVAKPSPQSISQAEIVLAAALEAETA